MTTFWPCPEVVTISDNQCSTKEREEEREGRAAAGHVRTSIGRRTTTGNKCSFELERDRKREERGSLEHICSNVNMDYGGGGANPSGISSMRAPTLSLCKRIPSSP